MGRALHRRARGVALLMVVSAIAILALVLIEFSNSSRTHMNAGVNVRDEMRASTMADTALVMTRACLDEQPWGAMAGFQSKVDLKKICDLLLGIFVRGRVDLPVGGLSVEMEGVQGLGISKGDIEEIELVPEETYIGLAGLWCKSKAGIADNIDPLTGDSDREAAVGCGSQMTVIKQLRSLLCDPAIAHWFETERADGKKYTREEIVGYLVDWVDPDDNGVTIDPLTWTPRQGSGENEDSYYRDQDERYRSKDAAFDSIEELRLVKGIDDELFAFLADKVSVHAESKINPNQAGPQVIASLIRAHNPLFDLIDGQTCGEEGSLDDDTRNDLNRYAQLIIEARRAREMQNLMSANLFGRTFRSANQFQQLAQDPATPILQLQMMMTGQVAQVTQADVMVWLKTKGFKDPTRYFGIKEATNWNALSKQLTFKDRLFRLRVRGRVGNMTRTLFAVLRKEGKSVRVVYYREE